MRPARARRNAETPAVAARLFLLAAILIALFPLFLVALNTLKPHAAIVQNPLALPQRRLRFRRREIL